MLWQVDSILFCLLVLQGLCDSQGNVWRCHPAHLYMIESTVPKVAYTITVHILIMHADAFTFAFNHLFLVSVELRTPHG